MIELFYNLLARIFHLYLSFFCRMPFSIYVGTCIICNLNEKDSKSTIADYTHIYRQCNKREKGLWSINHDMPGSMKTAAAGGQYALRHLTTVRGFLFL